MVAAFGLGGGWAAMDRAIGYSTQRTQGGAPLSEKQGYTHKLVVPHVIRLEAARAFLEETATRIDGGEGEEGALNTEGAIAKYLATEAGVAAADAAIQAHGGYGYTRPYLVEKIRRDVRITTISEGTSEIMEMTIARDRWQAHLKTRGEHYRHAAGTLAALHASHPTVGAEVAALGLECLADLLEACRLGRLTRNQHVLLRLGELIAYTESAAALVRRAVAAADGRLPEKADTRFDAAGLAVISRVFAREAALKVAEEGVRWVAGAAAPEAAAALAASLPLDRVRAAQAGLLADMDAVADAVYDRAGS
jgi:alkylation response protein AidB-like acyl-CoA dehydrogenase